MSLLEVTDLRVSFPTSDGVVQAVRGVSFRVEARPDPRHRGRVGEREERLHPDTARPHAGCRRQRQRPVRRRGPARAERDQMRHIRGAQIAAIFQDPLTSLHPLYKVGWQIVEMIRAHDRPSRKAQAQQRAVELLALVGIPQRGQAGRRLPAPVLRRHAAARDDRDGAGAEPAS